MLWRIEREALATSNAATDAPLTANGLFPGEADREPRLSAASLLFGGDERVQRVVQSGEHEVAEVADGRAEVAEGPLELLSRHGNHPNLPVT